MRRENDARLRIQTSVFIVKDRDPEAHDEEPMIFTAVCKLVLVAADLIRTM